MPHKSPRCPKCHAHTKQVVFLKANPHLSNDRVLYGTAQFKCKSCGYAFVSWGGIKRIGASITYRKYHPRKDKE